jgi:hypothetical protein
MRPQFNKEAASTSYNSASVAIPTGRRTLRKRLNYPPKSVQSALKVLDREGKINYRIK